MPDPATTTAGGFFGFKALAWAAAFFGAMVGLIFREPMTRPQLAAAFFVGVATARYLGPVLGALLDQVPALVVAMLPASAGHVDLKLPGMYEVGVFLAGVAGMNLIALWLRIVRDPMSAFRRKEGEQ